MVFRHLDAKKGRELLATVVGVRIAGSQGAVRALVVVGSALGVGPRRAVTINLAQEWKSHGAMAEVNR
jgi:hypothetical protein